MYGAGSKCELLARFRKEYLAGENCIVIAGYQPTIGIRQVPLHLISTWTLLV